MIEDRTSSSSEHILALLEPDEPASSSANRKGAGLTGIGGGMDP